MGSDSETKPRNPLWIKLLVIAALVGIFVNYWLATRLPPMALEASQAAIDQRLDELATYLSPPEQLGTEEFALRLAVDSGAAQQLNDFFSQEDTTMEDIDIALFPWSEEWSSARPDPVARSTALAHPPLRNLLAAWLSGTVKPSEEQAPSVRTMLLQRYAVVALEEALHRADLNGEPARWANRILDLIETQMVQQQFASWAIVPLMLGELARSLEAAPRLGLADMDRDALLNRIRGMTLLVASPQQASAMSMMGHLRELRRCLPGLEDDGERAKMVSYVVELGPYDGRVLAAMGIEPELDRERAIDALEVEVKSLSDGARAIALSPTNYWSIYEDARDRLDQLLRLLEQPQTK